MTKQDERQRIKQRLQEYAVELATSNRWDEAIEVNRQILSHDQEPTSYNCLGKAYIEKGMYTEAYEAYQKTIELNPNNTIARKNIVRLEALLARGIQQAPPERTPREQVDQRIFITEAGKTAITTLVDVPRCAAVEALTTSEKVELHLEGKRIDVRDADGNMIGRVEPQLAQRLIELIESGNAYVAVVVQCDTRQVQLLIREIYQDPSRRGSVSFPVKLSESTMYGYIQGLRYDYETEDMLDEEIIEEPEPSDDDFGSTDDDDEIRLDAIEKDMSDDDENED